jgi:hypothetical protein
MPKSSTMSDQGLQLGEQVLFMILVFMPIVSEMIRRRFFFNGLSPNTDSLSLYIVVSKFFCIFSFFVTLLEVVCTVSFLF